jgi:hypothetical protein
MQKTAEKNIAECRPGSSRGNHDPRRMSAAIASSHFTVFGPRLRKSQSVCRTFGYKMGKAAQNQS